MARLHGEDCRQGAATENLLKTGRLVHEGVVDTLKDLAAYSLLAIVLHEETLDD